MFSKIKAFFANEVTLEEAIASSLEVDQSGEPTDKDLHIATTVLMVEIAGADNQIAPQEGNAVVELLANEFGIAEDAVPEMVSIAIAARKEAGKIDEFVSAINTRFSVQQKQRVLALLWKIIQADGKIDKFEERLAIQMKTRFQLTDEQALAAREMAEDGSV